MCTLDKIIYLLKEQNKSQKDLTDFLGLTKNTFTNWKSGNNTSYKKYVYAIAEFFDVSVDYLLGNTDNVSAKNSSLTEKEKELISRYRNKPEMQSAVDKLLGLDEYQPQLEVYAGQVAALGGDMRDVPIDKDKLEKIDKLTKELRDSRKD